MYEIQVNDIQTKEYITQQFSGIPRIGERIDLQPHDKFPDFDTTSHYRVRDVLRIAGNSNETGYVDAVLYVERIG